MLSSKSEQLFPIYLAESRHNPRLTEQKDLYLGIKVLTTALSYHRLFMIVFYGWKLQNICRVFSKVGKRRDKWAELNLKMALGHFAVCGKFSGSGKSSTEVPQNLWHPSNRWKWKTLCCRPGLSICQELFSVDSQTYWRALLRVLLDGEKKKTIRN